MAELARDSQLDATLALLREGYTFVSCRCGQLGTDVFETRLRVFYEPAASPAKGPCRRRC